MKRLNLLSLLWLWTTCLQATTHFLIDPSYRQKVFNDYETKKRIIGTDLFREIDSVKDSCEAEALRFLYAYMPLADITDYSVTFHLQNIRASLQARQEMPWGSRLPDLLFRHFVLPERVNNEALDSSRMVFFRELKQRVQGLSMQEAILETNHWCHERVTYAPSDGRTLSPLACVRNALGRCGEESTFTVAALRSIGIPARQVYTPRWAHTDDNHAWVEAWADGQWYFLGACEPEPVLNLGWFNLPASRAMLMHTRAFGDYNGPEEVMLRTSNFTEINLIDNYGSSARIDFFVIDEAGQPVSDARVDFKIYNYAEFCTVATKYTSGDGTTFLTAGKGDMLVWASQGGRFGYAKASFGMDSGITITIRPRTEHPQQSEMLDIVPPPEQAKLPEVGTDARQICQLRFAREDSIRHAYEATFYTPRADKSTDSDWEPLLRKSRGNWKTILSFIERHPDLSGRVKDLLNSISDKDLCDMPESILEDNLNARSNQLSPRVENEMIIHPYKQLLQDAFDEPTRLSMRHDPSLLVQWVRDSIRMNPDTRALRIAQSPVGVWQSRMTDTRSRDIFFVSLARSLSIEARKDAVTGKVQYKREAQPGEQVPWVDVNFDAIQQSVAPTGTLTLTLPTDEGFERDPKYYSHFTISRILPSGATSLLNFEEGQVDMGSGTRWSNTFRDGAPLDTGIYVLTTGTRLANGSVLASQRFFSIHEGKNTRLPLVLRQSDTEVCVIGTFDSESRIRLLPSATIEPPVSILSQTGRGYFTIGVVSVGQEPTDHALRDIARASEAFDQWGRPLLLLFENEAEVTKFRAKDFGVLPKNLILGIDVDGDVRRQLATLFTTTSGKATSEPAAQVGQLPIFVIADTFNRVVFRSQGYTIGLGEQMERTIRKL